MRRRSILQALAGLVGAKSLPAAAPVKIPASLQVAKATAMANPMFTGGYASIDGHTLSAIIAQQNDSFNKRKWHTSIQRIDG